MLIDPPWKKEFDNLWTLKNENNNSLKVPQLSWLGDFIMNVQLYLIPTAKNSIN